MNRPKIIYWTTSCLEPEIEAISKEVFTLAKHFRPSFVFGISQHYIFKFSRRHRYIGFNPKFYPFLRLLVPILEQWADINHVYGEISPWLYYKALRKKPIVLTIASEKGLPVKEFLHRCSAIVVQTERMKKKLIGLGIEQSKIYLVYPGTNLHKFKPADSPPPLDKPKILFATAPRTKEELEARGVNFLIDVARLNPDIHFHFLYRPWANGYTSLEATRHLIEKYQLKNVMLSNKVVNDMTSIYRACHFTIIPYTKEDGGKECPNSLVESLACSVPVLVSDVSPFSDFVRQERCGLCFSLNDREFFMTLAEGMRRYEYFRQRAIDVAKNFFNKDSYFAFYEGVYFSCNRLQ
ncbi:glycosyltransferase family 4 protein [Desulfovulcanus sp.]